MKILLTQRARNDLFRTYDHLVENWSKTVADDFFTRVSEFKELVKIFPRIGVIEVPKQNIHSFVLTSQVRAFYRVKKKEVIIISFFDVRQDPSKAPS